MKVFQFKYDGSTITTIGSPSLEQAKSYFSEFVTDNFEQVEIEEVPESKWDKKNINVYGEPDDFPHPFKISIREALQEGETSILSTNDNSLFD